MSRACKDTAPITVDTPFYRGKTVELGDVFYSPSGHLPSVTAGTQLITFSPTRELAEVMAVVGRNLAQQGQAAAT